MKKNSNEPMTRDDVEPYEKCRGLLDGEARGLEAVTQFKWGIFDSNANAPAVALCCFQSDGATQKRLLTLDRV